MPSRFWIVWLLLGGLAEAQWVHFQDRTAGRLVLSSIPGTDSQEKDLAGADFDRDGWTDVVVVRKKPFAAIGGDTDLLLMNENGILTDRTSQFAPEFLTRLTDARDVFVIDVDGDEWLDLVLANTFGEQPACYRNQGEDAEGNWLGFVDESAARFPILTIPDLQFCAVCARDITGDGAPDLYFSNYVKAPKIAKDVLLVNDGTGHFSDESELRLGQLRDSAFGTSVDLRDMDNDGDRDIVKTSSLNVVPPWNEIGVFILFNEGDGTFRNWQSVPTITPYMFAVDDLTNDGLLDLYIVNDSQDYVVTCVTIDPLRPVPIDFDKVVLDSPRTTFLGGNLQCADLDQDGDLDVIVADVDIDLPICETGPDDPRKLALLRNDGAPDGRLADPYGPEQNPWNLNVFDFVVLDIDRDGKLDLLAGLCEGYAVLMQENTLHLPDSAVDFGEIILGESPIRSVMVCNNGTEELLVTGVSVSDPAYQLDGTGFTLQPFDCREIAVTFSPGMIGPHPATLTFGGELSGEVTLAGTAVTPPEAVPSTTSIEVRLPSGEAGRESMTISNAGGSELRFEVKVRVAETLSVLLLADEAARPALEKILQEEDLDYALGDLEFVSTESIRPYDTLLVGLTAGEVSAGSMLVVAEAVANGKTVVMIGASTDSDFLDGLQPLLTHIDEPGWKEPASPQLRVVDTDHPLSDGLPAEYDFFFNTASWYRIQPADAEAWVAAENGDGVPCLLSKRIGAGVLVYFTNWPLSGVWTEPADQLVLVGVVRNGVGAARRAWLSVKPRLGTLGIGESLPLEFVFHTDGLGTQSVVAEVVITTNDPLQPEIVIPVRLEALLRPLKLPALRVRSVRGGLVELDLWGQEGIEYRIERSGVLQGWESRSVVRAQAGVTSVEEQVPVQAEAQYYRAVELEP